MAWQTEFIRTHRLAHPTMPLPTDDRRTASRADTSPRRTRLRLRDVCDEVIASHRLANGADPLTADDRTAAAAVLSVVTPKLAGRSAR